MRSLLFAACLLSLAFTAVSPHRRPLGRATPPAPKLKTIKQTLAMVPTASAFFAGLKAAGLDTLLNGPAKTPYTVFVPTNEAFAHLEARGLGLASSTGKGLDQHQQELLLRFHVVPGRYPTEALKPGMALRTLNGAFPVKVSTQGTRVFVSGTNTAPVELTNAYIVCDNGVIHLIDEVLVPFTRTAAPARK